jgi:hypothetical protein
MSIQGAYQGYMKTKHSGKIWPPAGTELLEIRDFKIH